MQAVLDISLVVHQMFNTQQTSASLFYEINENRLKISNIRWRLAHLICYEIIIYPLRQKSLVVIPNILLNICLNCFV